MELRELKRLRAHLGAWLAAETSRIDRVADAGRCFSVEGRLLQLLRGHVLEVVERDGVFVVACRRLRNSIVWRAPHPTERDVLDGYPRVALENWAARLVVGQFYEIYLVESGPPETLLDSLGEEPVTTLMSDLRPSGRRANPALRALVLNIVEQMIVERGEPVPFAPTETAERRSLPEEWQLVMDEELDRRERSIRRHEVWPRIRTQRLASGHLSRGRPVAAFLERRLYALLHPFFPCRGRFQGPGHAADHRMADYPPDLLGFLALATAARWPGHHLDRTPAAVASAIAPVINPQ